MKRGFTLAEVLITLGIIGVVAALTIPALIASYQKKMFVTQLQKSYNVMSNGMKLMMANDGASTIHETEYHMAMLNAGVDRIDITTYSQVPKAMDIMKKYFNVIRIDTDAKWGGGTGFWDLCALNDKSNRTSGSTCGYCQNCIKYYLSDGSTFYGSLNTGVILDVNGDKGPNLFGRDAYWTGFAPGGEVYFRGSKQYENEKKYWRDDETLCGKPDSPLSDVVTGHGCGTRIMENGWVMDY
jgi:prepilin-type N-terminal cleavage/methylation domain-containing protein